MGTKLKTIVAILLLLACGEPSVEAADLHFLNGYWEISRVGLPDGSQREYGLNTSVDFIQYREGEGYRRKMQPGFDGRYATSGDSERFTLGRDDKGTTLDYKNELSSWSERLLAVDSLSFTVVNAQGITYTYWRFEPIKIPQ